MSDSFQSDSFQQISSASAGGASPALRRMGLFVYLVPVMGAVPALWTLSKSKGDRQQRYVSRLSVTLASSWLLGYTLLGIGNSGGHTLWLLILSSLLTSGYFLTSLWLMAQLWRRKQLWLPGLSALSRRL